MEEVRSQTDMAEMEEEHDALRREKKQVEEVKSRLQRELSVISRQSGSRGVLETLRRDRRDKEELYQTELVAGWV